MNIKGFDEKLCCRGMQFKIGNIYDTGAKDNEIEICSNTVYHYCKSIQDAHRYYNVRENNRFCEIEVLGVEVNEDEKYGSNRIKIVREIIGDELNNLIGYTNGNTGIFNSGGNNCGDRNSGDRNCGDYNCGNRNCGHYNCGSRNCGYDNSGYDNSGNCNSGNWNSGNCNSGNCNSGNCNSGNCNSGLFNSCNNSNGVFCTVEPTIKIFNIDSGMTLFEFKQSKYYDALFSSVFNLTKWIEYTEEEKRSDEIKNSIGGYLKEYSYKETCKNWWNNMEQKYREIIMSMPNFDKAIFEEITGIKL